MKHVRNDACYRGHSAKFFCPLKGAVIGDDYCNNVCARQCYSQKKRREFGYY